MNANTSPTVENEMMFDIREIIGLTVENAGSRQFRMDCIWMRYDRGDRF